MRSRKFFPLLAAFCATLFASTSSARETVVEDSPGRLVLEVEVPGAYRALASAGGARIVTDAFWGLSEPGAPDLPWLRFQVATGDRLPTVSIEPLEWTEVSLPGVLAGVPEWITPTQSEVRKDASLFAAGRALSPVVSEIHTYRGMPLRTVSLPLGTYAEGEGHARLLRKVRVRVDFPSPGSSPSLDARVWLKQADVKNPGGGAYLTAPPRSAPLRRAAAAAQFDPVAGGIRIAIGDRVVDGFAEDGLYALDYEAAHAAGIQAGVQVGRLRMYAGPNDTISRFLGARIAPTLSEIPIEVQDNNGNQTFDGGDRILFYAHGTSLWKPIPGATGLVRWGFTNDPYSFENHYYLQWSGSETGGMRLDTAALLTTGDTVTAAPHYLRAERDLLSGSCDPARAFDTEAAVVWFWHGRFTCAGSGGSLTLLAHQLRSPSWDSLVDRASDTALVGVFNYLGNTANSYTLWSRADTLPYAAQGVPGAWYRKANGWDADMPLLDSMRWVGSSPTFEGYTVRYIRSLEWTANRMVFPAATDRRIAYKISGAPSGTRVLRVVNGVGVRWLAVQHAAGAMVFSDSVAAGQGVLYFLADPTTSLTASALAPEGPSTADGVIQDLRDGSIGGARQNPEYVIIAPAALLPEAVQLRNYREGRSLPTSVVRVEDIYREWSGGRLSPMAIRDLLRWARDRWGAGGTPGRLRYVLLFGDGHYDYRNLLNSGSGSSTPNHIPPFNWNNNFETLVSDPASTDDFYAVVDSGKFWNNSTLDLAVGRLPIRTRAQGRSYLEKVARYEDPATSGTWRGRVLLAGDDATQRSLPGGRDPVHDHTRQAEEVGDIVLAQDSGMRKEQIYLFDYPINSSFLKPEAAQALLSGLNQGTLLFTFFGHGAYNQLANEVFLKTNDGLSRLKNEGKAFGMMIFSCTVGRFDKLADQGMVEEFIRQKDYAAIAGVAASRETFSARNERLGKAFAGQLFSPATDTAPLGIGELLRRAKNSNMGDVFDNRKYVLLGEPVVVLNRQGLGLRLDSVPDTLRALGCGSLSGRVLRGSGRGAVNVRIVSGDYPKTYATHYGPIQVQRRGQILFERTVPYVDSAFFMEYFLPKQVPFGDTATKIQIFAWDSLELRESALLVANLRIADTPDDGCMVNDQRGPRIAVTGCNVREAGADFPGSVKMALPYCLQISVSDTGGGVLAGDGPDQGVTVEVVGALAPFQPAARVDDIYLKSYELSLSSQELQEGTHLLKISARDGFGNLSQRQINLQITRDTVMRFVRAFNVPNPMKGGGTTFWFSTLLPMDEGGEPAEPEEDRFRYHVRIFNQQGHMVREFRDAVSGETRWDGRDAWGRRLANGMYFYDVTARSNETDGGRRVSRKNTLVISR